MKNCRRTAYGWQLYTRIGSKFVSEHLTQTDPPSAIDIRNWIHFKHAEATRPDLLMDPGARSFADDVADYLTTRTTMLTIGERQMHMAWWKAQIGRLPTSAITSLLIRQKLERLSAAGYAGNTVNHYRTALLNFFTVLNGKGGANPVKDVPRYPDESLDAPPRALSHAAADLVLGCMGESLTRARLDLFRWTGWPPAQMARLEPDDVKWGQAVRVKPRRKGKGAKGAWLPLLPDAWAALATFKRLGAWGPYSASSARTRFRHAARKARRRLALAYARREIDRSIARRLRAELIDITPYQLRHTFGTMVAATSKDDRAVQVLLQHADIRSTHRYTAATADPRASAALNQVAEVLRLQRLQAEDKSDG